MYRLILALTMAALPALAGEYVVLSSGFRIHADHHDFSGESVRLFTQDGGVTELPASLVKSFDAEDFVPAAVAEPVKVEPVAPPPSDPKVMVREAAVRTGLPPELVQSVARIESNFRPDAVSPKGALGVMQLMPATAEALAADPKDNLQNIDAGARLLRELLIKYDGDVVKALAAYNAGESAVTRYGGVPPYRETQDYVDKVIRAYKKAGGR